MNDSHSFFTTLVTALAVSLVVTAAYHLVVATKSTPDPVAKLEPVKVESVEVPNLTGLRAAEAKTRLENLGLTVTLVQEESDTVDKDFVISTTPDRYTRLKAGASVELKASIGRSMVVVPKVKRMPPKKARKILEEAGFVVEIKTILNEDFSFDRVLRQEPKEGEEAKKGSTVIITVNTEDEY